MIKLSRPSEPGYLSLGKGEWTSNLMAAVSKYGSYKKIPENEKEKLIQFYRHENVKSPLSSSSWEKCAFCESKPGESGNIEIEHFLPKSIYPNMTFEWANLLPSCRKCNERKSAHDTGGDPIVNPYDQDPAGIFYYKDIKICAKNGSNKQIGESTIKVCGLNSVRLWKPRSEILVSLRIFGDAIGEAIEDLKEADTERKKINRVRRLREAMEKIEALTKPEERYSSFCRSFLDQCEEYLEAKSIIETEEI